MTPKARGLAQHGGPPGWLEASDPAGCDFVCDGRSIPPALADHNNVGVFYIKITAGQQKIDILSVGLVILMFFIINCKHIQYLIVYLILQSSKPSI
jgi:hypothetical protein